jgi:hypothetical protein
MIDAVPAAPSRVASCQKGRRIRQWRTDRAAKVRQRCMRRRIARGGKNMPLVYLAAHDAANTL